MSGADAHLLAQLVGDREGPRLRKPKSEGSETKLQRWCCKLLFCKVSGAALCLSTGVHNLLICQLPRNHLTGAQSEA